MLSNKEVSGLFKTLAGLMELHNENDFKAKSYANAAFQLGRVSGHVMQMDIAQLESTPGIGKSVAGKIIELQQTGTMQVLQNLLDVTPAGILDILRIKGLGGKKVAVIWKELNVENAGELLYACYENRLSKLKGFGEKTQQSVIQAIEYYQNNLGKFHYASVAAYADELVVLLKKELQSEYVSICGEMRRQCNIINAIEIIAAVNENAADILQHAGYLKIEKIEDDKITGRTSGDVPFVIFLTQKDVFYYDLFRYTGNDQHITYVLERLSKKHIWNTEEEIYAAAGLQYVQPALRDADIDLNTLEQDDLIAESDIKGVVHSHSTWSDGKNTLEEMADVCQNAGYEYLVISDHSRTAVYAGGLSIEKILEQHTAVDALNKKMAPFKIFKSIESDILNDGSLDYPDDILSRFDLVIASVHSNLKMTEEKATARLLKAIENPYTTILGHMTGRLLLSRQGYPVDHKKIIEACASNKVIIEINANPYRLDIDHSWIPYALKMGVLISVDPDAHSIDGIKDIHWGVISARKGALTKKMTWNALSVAEVEDYLAERKKQKGIV